MTIYQGIIFGFVQGITEFLPISSSGHLAMLGYFFKIENAISTAILLHIATLFSVVFCYRKELVKILKNPFGQTSKKLVLATFVSGLIAVVLNKFAKSFFESIKILPYMFLTTAIVLICADLFAKKRHKTKKLGVKNSLVVGIAQGLAVLPGISRSGSTISALLFCDVEREEAADFSFLLSVPIIIASAIFEFFDLKKAPIQNFAILPNLVGFVVAFFVGIFAIKVMKKFVKKARLWWFSIYLILLAITLFVC